MNHYDVLKVNQNAHTNEINQAFRILAKKYHPDFNKNNDAAEKFIHIHEAYSVLKNLNKRKEYNESLYKKSNNAEPPPSAKREGSRPEPPPSAKREGSRPDCFKQNNFSGNKDKTYKIGDTGPAGGIVFYDNGNKSSIWRYMEVSPVDVKNSFRPDERAQWSPYDFTEYFRDEKKIIRYRIFLTKTGIGCGKKNTEHIIDVLKRESKKRNCFLMGNAAQLCREYNLNGYNDWYLPSKDELNELYKSVIQHNFKGFSNLEHWSSSKTSKKTVWAQFFKDGSQAEYDHNHIKSVRAVRYF